MNDIRCGKCGEPWELYYVNNEMTEGESDDFRRGKGCPCCDWGDNEERIGDSDEQGARRVEQVSDMVFGADDRDPLEFL